MKILVTGGAGFIGSAVIRQLIRETDATIVNLDKLTYAATPEALEECAENPRYRLVQGDIRARDLLAELFEERDPDAVMHLAAESHVDRSIDGPADFLQTNIFGTFALLEAARAWRVDRKGAGPMTRMVTGGGVSNVVEISFRRSPAGNKLPVHAARSMPRAERGSARVSHPSTFRMMI